MNSGLDNRTRVKLESLLDMGGGYVLDFSNRTFADFVVGSVGFDPYERYADRGSKANILRALWAREEPEVVARLNVELLEHWDTINTLEDRTPTGGHQQLYVELLAQFSGTGSGTQPDLDFLNEQRTPVDLNALPVALTARDVVKARLDEVENCMQAEAWLAVVFLVGSTLEGLLQELAMANASTYTADAAAPKRKEKTKPLKEWTLAELIQVSRAVGFLGEDVLKHADSVREFRNYIHPRQQLAENSTRLACRIRTDSVWLRVNCQMTSPTITHPTSITVIDRVRI